MKGCVGHKLTDGKYDSVSGVYAPLFSDLLGLCSLLLTVCLSLSLIVSSRTYCSSAHLHVKAHIHLVEKEVDEGATGRGRLPSECADDAYPPV